MVRGIDRWAWITAGVLVGLIFVLPWSALDPIVPEPLLVQVRRNNEALAFTAFVVLLLPAIFGRPQNRPGAGWWATLAALFLVTELTPNTVLPQWIITLNEGVLGVAILSAYLYGRRDRERRPLLFYPLLALVVLIGELPIGGWRGSPVSLWIMDHAEAVGFATIAAVYLDVVRRWPFRPQAYGWRWVWYPALLVMAPVLSYVNQHGVEALAATTPVEAALVWVQRITEAFIAGALVAAYFDIRMGLLADRHPAASDAASRSAA